jgi:hypothetical protein
MAMEAATGIEPAYKGLAGLCLTAWLRRLISFLRSRMDDQLQKARWVHGTHRQGVHQLSTSYGSNSYEFPKNLKPAIRVELIAGFSNNLAGIQISFPQIRLHSLQPKA